MYSAIFTASKYGFHKVVKRLLKYIFPYYNIFYRDKRLNVIGFEQEILHIAIFEGQYKTLKILLKVKFF